MFAKWIYLIASIILTIFFLGLAWVGDTLLPLIAVCVIGWDTYRTLKPIPFVVSQRSNLYCQCHPIDMKFTEEEVNLFTDFIREEDFSS